VDIAQGKLKYLSAVHVGWIWLGKIPTCFHIEPKKILMFFRIKRWTIEREWLVPTGKGAGLLAYHGVDRSGDTRFNKLHIGARDFEAQLAYLKKYDQVVSLKDFYEGRYDTGRFDVAFTFDDARRNNFTYALPLLEK
jgi:hypothetical protein